MDYIKPPPASLKDGCVWKSSRLVDKGTLPVLRIVLLSGAQCPVPLP